MEVAAELDASRDEANPQQAAQAVQGSPRQSSVHHLDPGDIASDGRVSSPGASTTTAKPRLYTKSPFEGITDGFGDEKGGNVVTLQPRDEGFGAWSYVAGAFAMYIVVWGKCSGVHGKKLSLSISR